MDLVSFVVQPTWKEMLLQLVATEQMDPWDVDVGLVASKYLERIREIEALDLRIPANVILAASLLLRFKAQDLLIEEEEENGYEEPLLQQEASPELVFRAYRPRRRRVTLDELVRSLEEVMRKGKKQIGAKSLLPPLFMEVSKDEIDKRMATIYEKILGLKDSEGIVLFSALLAEKTGEQVARYLIPVLHLVQEQKLYAWQDEFFGEIFLKPVTKTIA